MARKFLALAVVTFSYIVGAAAADNVLPNCSSDEVRRGLKQAIEQSPAAKIVHFVLFDLGDIHQIVPPGSDPAKRTCVALAYLNSGKEQITYTIEWVDRDKGTYWLEIQP